MKKNQTLIIASIATALVIIIFFLVGYKTAEQKVKQNALKAQATLQETCENRDAEKENQIVLLQNKLLQLEEEKQAADIDEQQIQTIASAFGFTPDGDVPADPDPFECQTNEKKILSLTQYLDAKNYTDGYDIDDGATGLLVSSLIRLKKNTPRVVNEKDGLLTIIRNISYLYRVLGKDRILCLRKIMNEEPELIEVGARVFYQWEQNGGDCGSIFIHPPSFNTLYEYACFFLDTIGGRSYLFRRDSKTRMLIMYYSTLIIHQANQQKLNKYGFDIRPVVDTLIQDINQTKHLIYKDHYLQTLEGLKTIR